MASLITLTLFGLLANYGRCQFPMPALGGAGLMEGITPEMAMLMSSGGGGGGGGGGPFGGLDPALLLAGGLGGAGGGGGGGGGGMSDMMRMAMLSNMFRPEPAAPAPVPMHQAPAAPAAAPGGQANSLAKNIADMLGGGSPGITVTPQQQNQLWNVVQMSQNSQRVFDAIQHYNDRVQLERDGLPQVPRMMSMTMCPLPRTCPMMMCETTEIPYLPETFYVCQGCPRCVMDAATRRNMLMFSDISNRAAPGGAAGGGSMMQNLMMAQQFSGSSGGSMNPAMLAALMAPPPQQPAPAPAPVQAPQPPPAAPGFMMNPSQMQAMLAQSTSQVSSAQGPPMIPPGFKLVPTNSGPAAPSGGAKAGSSRVKGTPKSPPPPPSGGAFPKPPPEFVEAMKRMRQIGESMRGQRTGAQPAR